MKLTINLSSDQIKILNLICIDSNHAKYIEAFLEKELFGALKINESSSAPAHIRYYDEIERLIKLVGLTQQEIADQLGFSQAAIQKAFKTQNERSIIYRAMTQRGTPNEFILTIIVNALRCNDETLEAINNCLALKGCRRHLLTQFFSMLYGFALRKNNRFKDQDQFVATIANIPPDAVNEIDLSILENADIDVLVSTMSDLYGKYLR